MAKNATELTALRLKKKEGRQAVLGHSWVFSNAIDTRQQSIKSLGVGEWVTVQDYRGEFVGIGYANPASLICVRLLTRDPKQTIGTALVQQRIASALALRETLRDAPYYRLIYGESDGLPGLVVDRFNQTLVVQITTAGMEHMLALVQESLIACLNPECIILRNDNDIRKLENLTLYTKVSYGEAPEHLHIQEGRKNETPARFTIPLTTGQKTGWFFDQVDNRRLLPAYVKEKRVLDVCCYAGGWAIQAALHGAESVTAIDSSTTAIELTNNNAQQNRVANKLTTINSDAFDALRELRQSGQTFDTVIVDPPAFIKRKKDYDSGQEAYRRLNEAAMQVMVDDGILISCSCSYHLPRQALIRQLQRAAKRQDKTIQILHHGFQSADHPIDPAVPETEYLKVIFLRVLNNASR